MVVKNLQNEKKKLRQKWEQLERCAKYESNNNALAQYCRRNNVVQSGIPDSVSDDTLEESVVSVLADVDVYMNTWT